MRYLLDDVDEWRGNHFYLIILGGVFITTLEALRRVWDKKISIFKNLNY